MPDNSDELSIIDRFKKGDDSAFEELLLKYEDRIYNLCRHMLGNVHDAEDAAQDAFIKAFQGLARFQSGSSLYTWLYRIAMNTCIDFKRKPFFESLFRRSESDEEIVIEQPSNLPSPEKDYESKQISMALHKALRKLSPKLRAAIILKEIEGLSYEDIAEALDISVGTVKSRISRARDELKVYLKDFREQK